MKPVQRYLVAGLLVWVPLGVTFIILKFVVDLIDETLILVPAAYRPENLLGFRIPGLGILLTGVVVFVTGIFTANFAGRRLFEFWNALLYRIPLVRSIYGSAQKFSEVVFTDRSKSFQKALLVEYPRKGVWRLAFQTATVAEFQQRTTPDAICVFVPNSPNVAAGFLVILPRGDVIELDMDVESAVKMIVSLGVVAPQVRPEPERATLARAGPGA